MFLLFFSPLIPNPPVLFFPPALSPILFRFYIFDLGLGLLTNKLIKLFKFADDGTLKIIGSTTEDCLKTLQIACNVIYQWSLEWRMIINCDKDKTELICFGTAEKRPELVPESFKLGNSTIQFVDKTVVLGLTMDNKLSYIDHGKAINKKILSRWVTICKFSNRNWGFRQHVIVCLLEVLVATCIQYAGIVWINHKSILEVQQIWIKMLKSATGAVFHVDQNALEAILGVLPIGIFSKVNNIKHYLKLIINKGTSDPLLDLTHQLLQEDRHSASIFSPSIKETFKFISWKAESVPGSVSKDDLLIVNSGKVNRFRELSHQSCTYSKSLIKKYSAVLWQERMNIQFQLDGYDDAPQVSTDKLSFPPKSTRRTESTVLSLFYPNNLFNTFLFRYDSQRFPSPLCSCGNGQQDALHVLLYCNHVNPNLRAQMEQMISKYPIHDRQLLSNGKFLISWSRKNNFLGLCVEIYNEIRDKLRFEIVL